MTHIEDRRRACTPNDSGPAATLARSCRRSVVRFADAAAQPVLWGESLIKSHDGARKQLDDTSLVLREGQRCAVVGHNGCGKSTLLDIIAGAPLDGGGVRLRKGVKVTAVQQEPLTSDADAKKTVRDVLLGGDGADVAAARASFGCVDMPQTSRGAAAAGTSRRCAVAGTLRR